MSNGTTTWNYTYNADGMRTFRTNNDGGTYRYVYNGGELDYLRVTEKDANGNEIGWVMRFSYTPDGVPLTISYAGSTYYYITNLQGDVVALTDSYGNTVVEYTYDAWGNPLSTFGSMANSLGKRNPLRYRGYVYDRETGLYYLQSRYYDPEVGRFINADTFVATGQGLLGNNMFAYCGNNPVMGCDPCGTCIHNWKFYNCEKCAAFWNGIGEWCVDAYNKINNVYQQQAQLQTQITMQQNKMIADAAKTTWDAYEHSIELQAQEKFRQDMVVKNTTEVLISDPLLATDIVTGTIGLGTTYIGTAATISGVSIPVAGQVALGVVGIACGLWGIARLVAVVYKSL